MMLFIAYICLLAILLAIAIQDVKYRVIHIGLLLLLFIIALTINYIDPYLNIMQVVYNNAFIAINILGLFLYFSFKEKQFSNPVDSKLGLGDILFFIAITPLLDLRLYIAFFICGLIFSLAIHLISNIFRKVETIPLAGYLSIFMGFGFFLKVFLKIEIPML